MAGGEAVGEDGVVGEVEGAHWLAVMGVTLILGINRAIFGGGEGAVLGMKEKGPVGRGRLDETWPPGWSQLAMARKP
jgi:hypothetical protein